MHSCINARNYYFSHLAQGSNISTELPSVGAQITKLRAAVAG
jgi:hypothetical protein